jgi:hypothetical protein
MRGQAEGGSDWNRFQKADSGPKKGDEDCWMRGVGSSMLGVGRVRGGSGHRPRFVETSLALVDDGDDLKWRADLKCLEGGCR